MNTHADKTQENKSQSVANGVSQVQAGGDPTFQFVDNRPETVAQRKLQEMANNSPQAKQAAQLHQQIQSLLIGHGQSRTAPVQRTIDKKLKKMKKLKPEEVKAIETWGQAGGISDDGINFLVKQYTKNEILEIIAVGAALLKGPLQDKDEGIVGFLSVLRDKEAAAEKAANKAANMKPPEEQAVDPAVEAAKQAQQAHDAAVLAAYNQKNVEAEAEFDVVAQAVAGNSLLTQVMPQVKSKVRSRDNRNISTNKSYSEADAAAAATVWKNLTPCTHLTNFHSPNGGQKFASKWRRGDVEVNMVLACKLFGGLDIYIHIRAPAALVARMKEWHRQNVPQSDNKAHPSNLSE